MQMTVRIRCGSGVYIRSLARDMGDLLVPPELRQAMTGGDAGAAAASSVGLPAAGVGGCVVELQRILSCGNSFPPLLPLFCHYLYRPCQPFSPPHCQPRIQITHLSFARISCYYG